MDKKLENEGGMSHPGLPSKVIFGTTSLLPLSPTFFTIKLAVFVCP
jgi:hypothetical protein